MTKDNAGRPKDIVDSKNIEETELLRSEVVDKIKMYTEYISVRGRIMNKTFLIPVTEMLDITKIEEYNQKFIKTYPNSWKPFVTKNNFDDYLKQMSEYKEGKGNEGLKEIFYWFFDNDKIVGSGSIRLNPEIDKNIETYTGHIFYQIVPTYRRKGYGKLLCHLLLEEMQKLGFKEAIIPCYNTNIGSISIIEANGGELIETVNGDGSPNSDHLKTRQYKIDIDKSLLEYETRQKQNQA